jgi:prefoldin subunit 5
MSQEKIETLENKIRELENTNKIIQDELDTKTNDYKKMTMELGQVIFQNEDYEYENRKLKEKIESLNARIEELEEENKKLKNFKEEVESSTTWKLKSKFS